VTRRVVATLLLSAVTASAAAAQKDSLARVFVRHLDGGRDTNSAGDYFTYGLSVMRTAPEEAERAFYWVSRLDPRRADGYYGQFVAWFCADPRRIVDPGRDKDERRRVFDERAQAFLRDPFVAPRLDRFLTALVRREMARGFRQEPDWEALSEGRYAEAARLFRLQMAEDSMAPEPHVEMAFVAYMVQQYDSTVAQLQEALRLRRKATAGKFQSVYGHF